MLKHLARLDASFWDWSGLRATGSLITRHRALLCYLAVIAVLAHPYTLFSFSLNMDSESHAFHSGPKDLWVAQGRWGMYLLNQYLLPDSVIPFFPPFIALAGCAIGAFFLTLTLSPVRSWADYLATPIAIGCPILYFALYFTTLGYGVGIGFATAAIGVYALTRWTLACGVAAIGLFAFSIGIYQALLPLMPVIFALYVAAQITDGERYPFMALLRQCTVFMVVLVLAYVAYQLVSQMLMAKMHLDFDSNYLGHFIQLQATPESLRSATIATIAGLDYYTGGSQFYINDLPVLKWLFTGSVLIVIGRLLTASSHGVAIRLLGLCVFLLALLAPLSMIFVSNGLTPPRTLPSVAFVIAGAVFIAARSGSPIIRFLIAALVIACFYKFCIINTRYAFASQMRWQQDRELSTRIIERMGLLHDKMPPPKNPGDPFPVVLVGELDTRKESPLLFVRSVVGDSFYAWGGGDTRMVGLWYTMGIFDYFITTTENNLAVAEAAEKMPAWPAEGAVAVINDIFVVKLSEHTDDQKTVICRENVTHPFCMKHGPF